ncbi:MAG: CRTAC1 family protein, partial [Bacteroidota bacterium]
AAADFGLTVNAFVKGVAFGDVDNDGDDDLYVSVLGGDNQLWINDRGAFREEAAGRGVAEPTFSFPTWFFDYDNDGDEDLFVSSYDLRQFTSTPAQVAREALSVQTVAERPRLYENDGSGRFSDVSESAGLDRVVYGMGSNYGDLDNDGRLDFYIGTGAPDLRAIIPNLMFRSTETGFEDVTMAGGFGHIQKGHAVAFADVDNDGDQDIFANIGGAVEGDVFQNALFENPGFGRGWIRFRLKGTASNRAAIGARVEIRAVDRDGNELSLHRTVRSGGSFGAGPLTVHAGLGDAERVTGVTVRWPSGTVQQLGSLETNRLHEITEPNG